MCINYFYKLSWSSKTGNPLENSSSLKHPRFLTKIKTHFFLFQSNIFYLLSYSINLNVKEWRHKCLCDGLSKSNHARRIWSPDTTKYPTFYLWPLIVTLTFNLKTWVLDRIHYHLRRSFVLINLKNRCIPFEIGAHKWQNNPYFDLWPLIVTLTFNVHIRMFNKKHNHL